MTHRKFPHPKVFQSAPAVCRMAHGAAEDVCDLYHVSRPIQDLIFESANTILCKGNDPVIADRGHPSNPARGPGQFSGHPSSINPHGSSELDFFGFELVFKVFPVSCPQRLLCTVLQIWQIPGTRRQRRCSAGVGKSSPGGVQAG
jgi:hypothetical protein